MLRHEYTPLRRVVASARLSARGRLLLKQAAAVGVLFGAWELLAGGFGGLVQPAINPALVPPPSAALADLVVYGRSGLLATDLATTLGAALIGLLLGMLRRLAGWPAARCRGAPARRSSRRSSSA